MADRTRGRESATRKIGTPPNVGRRFVRDGKVRIEWREDGRRRSRTIGSDTRETRKQADAQLEELLGMSQTDSSETEAERQSETVQDAAREAARALLNLVDVLVTRLRCWIDDLSPKD